MDNLTEYREEFEKNVQWLKKTMSPEDVYSFAQQLILTAEYFLDKWGEWANIEEEIMRDAEAMSRVKVLVQIYMLRKNDTDKCIREYLHRKDMT